MALQMGSALWKATEPHRYQKPSGRSYFFDQLISLLGIFPIIHHHKERGDRSRSVQICTVTYSSEEKRLEVALTSNQREKVL